MLSENMMRFGTKNLGPEQKRRLTLESVMQTINEHGLHGEVRRRLSEQATGVVSMITPGAAPVMQKKGNQQNFLYVHDAVDTGSTKRIHGMISPGRYPMTPEGDRVKVTTRAATFYLAGATGGEIVDIQNVAANVLGVVQTTPEMLKMPFEFVVEPGGYFKWETKDGNKSFNAYGRGREYIQGYAAKGGAQPR